jgi:rare lipoprotein A
MSCVEKTSRIHRDAALVTAASVRSVVRLFAVALGGAMLAGCAQSSVVSRNSGLFGAGRQVSVRHDHMPPHASIASRTRPAPFTFHRDAAGTRTVSQGLASFYSEGTQTASGEKFDANELTAAHPTLPFGTKLRVTNVATGRSVTVRVNDRGPYVPGRVVDVSYSAAQSLGMVGKGLANVRLDVVR